MTCSDYIECFKDKNISGIIRLNEPSAYDKTTFTNEGFAHCDLFFDDCTVPPFSIVTAFLHACEHQGGVAVHCTTGLGRSACLVALYILWKGWMKAREAIAWLRLMRPGSIIGPQMAFLAAVELSGFVGKRLRMDIDKEGALALLSPMLVGLVSILIEKEQASQTP